MLLSEVKSETKETPKLKLFSHFTLGCTYVDEAPVVKEALEKLSSFLKSPATFRAESIINLGTKTQPLWGVTLSLGSTEESLRATLSNLFDSIMCPERNGVLYLWKPNESSQKRCPHITIGPKQEDQETAKKLLELNCLFTFNRLDYKKVGPHDPHVIKNLVSETNTINLSSS